jgi:hypothetical protein
MSPASVAGDRQQVAADKDMITVIAATSGRAMATACRVDHGDSRWIFIVGGLVVGASPASGHGGAKQRRLALVSFSYLRNGPVRLGIKRNACKA